MKDWEFHKDEKQALDKEMSQLSQERNVIIAEEKQYKDQLSALNKSMEEKVPASIEQDEITKKMESLTTERGKLGFLKEKRRRRALYKRAVSLDPIEIRLECILNGAVKVANA